MPLLKKMWIEQALRLVQSGVVSNWWGLGCPSHCQGSLLTLGLTFCFGVSLGVVLSRAFNCYKGPDRDRMIIDRRGQNFAESRLSGPSLFIPVGPMLGMLEANPSTQTVCCSAADRKDFYHQLKVPPSRAVFNALGPALPRELVCRTSAFGDLLRRAPLASPGSCYTQRRHAKDLRPTSVLFDPDHYLVCFGSVAQGDHPWVSK